MRLAALWCALACAVGCVEDKLASTSTGGGANFGRFEGDVIAVWDQDGRNMTLREDFAYIDAQGRRWLAPKDSTINGASIPQGFWTFIGGPFEGRYRNASVVHDVGCHQMTEAWEDVHRMFYEACLCGGVDEAQAKMMYYAVYHFGPRWQTVAEAQPPANATADGQAMPLQQALHTVMRLDPVPPTPEEVEQVASFVSEDKPTLEAIERMSRDALHQRPCRSRGRWKKDWSRYREPLAPAVEQAQAAMAAAPLEERWTDPQGQPVMQSLSAEEQQWATQIVAAYLEQQAGAPVPAELRIRRGRTGYRVFVRYLQYDEQGHPFYYPGGHCAIWLSGDGQVREVAAGHWNRLR